MSKHFSIVKIRKYATTKYSKEKIQEFFLSQGSDFKNTFQSFEWIEVNEKKKEAIGRININYKELGKFSFHPGILDCALRTVMGLELNRDTQVMPFSIEKMSVIQPMKELCFSYAKKVGDYKYDIHILNELGEVLVDIKGFVLYYKGLLC